jgi:hypothetical protein
MTEVNKPKQQNSILLSERKNAPRVLPIVLLLSVVIPALPFFFSIATLSFFIDPSAVAKDIFVKQLFANTIEYIDQPLKTLIHLSDLLTYLSILSVHTISCITVIGFFLYQIHQLPDALIRRSYFCMSMTAVSWFVFAYIIKSHANELMLTQLGYKSICVLLAQADLQTSLVWPDPGGGNTGEACFLPKPTRLVWLAYTPILLGILAIISASAFTGVLASEPIPPDDEHWRPNFLARIKILQKSFYLLSLVLVTSTLTILLFTSLPLELLADATLKAALNKFINGITAFWGGLFTATLFATFAPAAFLFFTQAVNHQKQSTTPSDLREWLHESVFVSIKKQMINALLMIAPMLIGPLGNLLQNLSGLAG